MVITVGELEAILRLNDQLTGPLRSVTKEIKSTGEKWKAAGKKMRNVGLGLTGAVTLPILAVGAAVIKAAAEAVESENLFEVSFEGMADDARKWSEVTSQALGLNAFEMRKSAATIFVMVDSMGVAKDAAFDMSTGVATLAQDMASFFNIDAELAFNKIRTGLTGEAEGLKALGIVVNETTIKQVALTAGIIKQGESMTNAQKVQARWLTIQQATTKAQGDLARTMDSPINKMRIMKEAIQQARIELGMALLPTFNAFLNLLRDKVVPAIQGAVKWFTDMGSSSQRLVLVLLGIAAALGPLLIAMGFVASAIGSIGAVLGWLLPLLGIAGGLAGVLAGVVAFLTGPVGIAIAIGVVLMAWKPFRDVVISIGKVLYQLVRGGLTLVVRLLGLWWEAVKKVYGPLFKLAGFLLGKMAGALEWVAGKVETFYKALDLLWGASDPASVNELTEATTVLGEELDAVSSRAAASASMHAYLSRRVAALAEEEKAATAATEAMTAATEAMDEAVANLGFTTVPMAATRVATLALAIKQGEVPTKQLKAAINKLREELDGLGVLTPELEAKLNLMSGAVLAGADLAAEFEEAVERWESPLQTAIEYVDDLDVELIEIGLTAPETAAALDGVDKAMRRFNITIPDIERDMAQLNLIVGDTGFSMQRQRGAVEKLWSQYARGGDLTPELAEEFKKLAEVTGAELTPGVKAVEMSFEDLFSSIRTGNETIDALLGRFGKFFGLFKTITGALTGLGGKFGEFFGKLSGGLNFGEGTGIGVGGKGGFNIGSILGSLFGGGGKSGKVANSFFGDTGSFLVEGQKLGAKAAGALTGKMASILGAASSWAPMIGPLISAFGPLLMEGLGKLGKKVWGALKGMFGGPDGAEKEARRIGHSLDALIASALTGQDKVLAGNEQWKISNIGINRIYEAAGRSMAEAAAMATRLSDSVRMTPVEAQKVIDEIQAVYDAGIGAIGDTADAVVTTVTETAEQVAAVTAGATATATQAAQNAANRAIRDATRFGDAYVNAGDRISATFRDMKFDIPVGFDLGDLPGGFRGTSDSRAHSGIEGFARGGIVPGPIGAPRLVVAHGGESITPRGGGGGDRDFKDLLVEIQTLSAALRRAEDVREVTQRDRSLMGM